MSPAIGAGTALVLCGALAREVRAICQRHGWQPTLAAIDLRAHLRPERIPALVEARLDELLPQHHRVLVVIGECGTRGALDAMLERRGVARIAGPHCYEMYAEATFATLMEQEPGTFFLTDALVRSYEALVVRGLGLDRFPELRDIYFGNYRQVVYLMQRHDEALLQRAHAIAAGLGLPLELRFTGYGGLEARLLAALAAPPAAG
jgi:hypothetical protein